MVVHGSTVAIAGRAVLITGAAGVGKSSLALALMAMGAGLVSDDRTVLALSGGGIIADAPDAIRGRIEARHVGLLRADATGPQPLSLVVALGDVAGPRLPEQLMVEILGVILPQIVARYDHRLAPAVRQWLMAGRVA